MATAKKSRKSSGKKKKAAEQPPPPPPSSSSSSDSESDNSEEDQGDDMKLTLEALDAMSDDSDGNDGDDIDMEEDNEEGEGEGIGDGEAEAAALRKMISDGKFDGLLKNAKKSKKKDTKKIIGNGSDNESEGEEDDESGVYETANVDDGEYEEIEQQDDDEEQDKEEESDTERYWMSDPATKVNESEDDDSSSDSEGEDTQQTKKTSANIAMETAIQMANRNLPWAESFTIVPPTPLPFNPSSTSTTDSNKKRKLNASYTEEEDEEEEEEYVDVHDDLKREVAFYDNALESVTLAREQCESVGIPFTRPDDFFAEMVKSDDHMAKIKDRLIFETKKMEAVERRKSNKEQTAMAKERHAFRIAEKSKQKKEHMAALNDWKKNTERNRSNLGGKVNDWQDDEDQLRGMSGGGVNKKRMAANKKYGFGDKRGGRFKQNDKRTLNDMSGYNPKGGFGGIGQKSSGGKGKGKGKGKKRPGKRARDAKR